MYKPLVLCSVSAVFIALSLVAQNANVNPFVLDVDPTAFTVGQAFKVTGALGGIGLLVGGVWAAHRQLMRAAEREASNPHAST